MVRRIPVFQPGGSGSIPDGSGILISVLGLVVCPSCVVSGGGPHIVLTTHSGRPALVYLSSVLVQTVAFPTGI